MGGESLEMRGSTSEESLTQRQTEKKVDRGWGGDCGVGVIGCRKKPSYRIRGMMIEMETEE